MWKHKCLVFSVFILILVQQSRQDEEPNYHTEKMERYNSQIVLNFFLYGPQEVPPRQRWGRLTNKHEDCDCPNCNCEQDESELYRSIETFDFLNNKDEKAHYRKKMSGDCDCKDCDCEDCDCEDCDCKDCDCVDCDCKDCDCKNIDKKLVRVSSEINILTPNKIMSNSFNWNNWIDGWLNKMKDSFIKFIRDISDDIPAIVKCQSCAATVDIFLEYRRNIQIMSDDTLHELAADLCSIIHSKEFCEGVLNLHFDLIMYIVDSRPDLTAETICNITGQVLGCFVPRESDKFNSWKIDIPPPSKTFKPNINKNLDTNRLEILQISDIHYDSKYKKGNKVKCNEPICCRTKLGFLETFDEKAGQWGHYKKCDMPMEAVENLMQQTSQHDVDYVYFTGDVIAHNIWETSIESNSKSLVEIYQLFYHSFVSRNITVYPILGTHEFNPLNSNPPKDGPTEFSQQWLFDLIAKNWGTWLPEDTLATIKRGGFYTVVPKPGFRIIALNSNVASVYNWWLLYNDTDPYGQLQWLADTLSLAEQNNEYVHILSHVPPGEKDTYAKWAHEYSRIIHRFAHIITGQFCGHTHNVQMYYFHEPNNIEYPVNIMYNGGSFTTYQNNNPNYRIYYVDSETMAVENFHDWSYNLTMANKFGAPHWTYTNFRQTFGLRSMSNKEMGELVHKMVNNKSYLDTYFRLKVRSSDTSLQEGCNDKCMVKNLCNIFKTEADLDELCNYFVNVFKNNHQIKQ